MRWLLWALLWLLAAPALAHEVRPAYLELHEDKAGEFTVLWKTPMRGDLRLSLSPVFSARTQVLTPITTRQVGGAAVQRWRIEALEPLRGQMLRIDGLEATMTDALVRAEFADGTNWTGRFTPNEPAAMIPVRPSAWSVAVEYSKLGVEHILLGIDHLLFVLALLLITRGTWKLVQTITAFTLAHSATLALAALGFVHVPSAPVEAVIALSIVFVAGEALRVQRGQHGIAARAPWLVAFSFGLLHGFGFAGALAEIGLPQQHIPLALLFFNVGVELGQLLFVAAVLSLIVAIRRVPLRVPDGASRVLPYAIGSVATFWVFQRVAAF
jgi:hydrogenase/urease accessory protein HupE